MKLNHSGLYADRDSGPERAHLFNGDKAPERNTPLSRSLSRPPALFSPNSADRFAAAAAQKGEICQRGGGGLLACSERARGSKRVTNRAGERTSAKSTSGTKEVTTQS